MLERKLHDIPERLRNRVSLASSVEVGLGHPSSTSVASESTDVQNKRKFRIQDYDVSPTGLSKSYPQKLSTNLTDEKEPSEAAVVDLRFLLHQIRRQSATLEGGSDSKQNVSAVNKELESGELPHNTNSSLHEDPQPDLSIVSKKERPKTSSKARSSSKKGDVNRDLEVLEHLGSTRDSINLQPATIRASGAIVYHSEHNPINASLEPDVEFISLKGKMKEELEVMNGSLEDGQRQEEAHVPASLVIDGMEICIQGIGLGGDAEIEEGEQLGNQIGEDLATGTECNQQLESNHLNCQETAVVIIKGDENPPKVSNKDSRDHSLSPAREKSKHKSSSKKKKKKHKHKHSSSKHKSKKDKDANKIMRDPSESPKRRSRSRSREPKRTKRSRSPRRSLSPTTDLGHKLTHSHSQHNNSKHEEKGKDGLKSKEKRSGKEDKRRELSSERRHEKADARKHRARHRSPTRADKKRTEEAPAKAKHVEKVSPREVQEAGEVTKKPRISAEAPTKSKHTETAPTKEVKEVEEAPEKPRVSVFARLTPAPPKEVRRQSAGSGDLIASAATLKPMEAKLKPAEADKNREETKAKAAIISRSAPSLAPIPPSLPVASAAASSSTEEGAIPRSASLDSLDADVEQWLDNGCVDLERELGMVGPEPVPADALPGTVDVGSKVDDGTEGLANRSIADKEKGKGGLPDGSRGLNSKSEVTEELGRGGTTLDVTAGMTATTAATSTTAAKELPTPATAEVGTGVVPELKRQEHTGSTLQDQHVGSTLSKQPVERQDSDSLYDPDTLDSSPVTMLPERRGLGEVLLPGMESTLVVEPKPAAPALSGIRAPLASMTNLGPADNGYPSPASSPIPDIRLVPLPSSAPVSNIEGAGGRYSDSPIPAKHPSRPPSSIAILTTGGERGSDSLGSPVSGMDVDMFETEPVASTRERREPLLEPESLYDGMAAMDFRMRFQAQLGTAETSTEHPPMAQSRAAAGTGHVRGAAPSLAVPLGAQRLARASAEHAPTAAPSVAVLPITKTAKGAEHAQTALSNLPPHVRERLLIPDFGSPQGLGPRSGETAVFTPKDVISGSTVMSADKGISNAATVSGSGAHAQTAVMPAGTGKRPAIHEPTAHSQPEREEKRASDAYAATPLSTSAPLPAEPPSTIRVSTKRVFGKKGQAAEATPPPPPVPILIPTVEPESVPKPEVCELHQLVVLSRLRVMLIQLMLTYISEASKAKMEQEAGLQGDNDKQVKPKAPRPDLSSLYRMYRDQHFVALSSGTYGWKSHWDMAAEVVEGLEVVMSEGSRGAIYFHPTDKFMDSVTDMMAEVINDREELQALLEQRISEGKVGPLPSPKKRRHDSETPKERPAEKTLTAHISYTSGRTNHQHTSSRKAATSKDGPTQSHRRTEANGESHKKARQHSTNLSEKVEPGSMDVNAHGERLDRVKSWLHSIEMPELEAAKEERLEATDLPPHLMEGRIDAAVSRQSSRHHSGNGTAPHDSGKSKGSREEDEALKQLLAMGYARPKSASAIVEKKAEKKTSRKR